METVKSYCVSNINFFFELYDQKYNNVSSKTYKSPIPKILDNSIRSLPYKAA